LTLYDAYKKVKSRAYNLNIAVILQKYPFRGVNEFFRKFRVDLNIFINGIKNPAARLDFIFFNFDNLERCKLYEA